MVYHSEHSLIARGQTSPEMKQIYGSNPYATLNVVENSCS